ncbi:hypothetical protein Tco_1383891 [Tanacetum coccineum]
MYGFKECSSCKALYNREHCCSNVSSVDNFVRDPNPSSYDETPDSSQQPPRNCSKCGGPFGGLYCRQCTCERCRRNYTDEVCALCCYEVEKSFVNDSNPNSFIDSPNNFNPPPQPHTYSCEFCGNNDHYGYDCPPQVPFIYNPEPCYNQDFDNDFPQSFQSYPQQYLCCENCEGPHETFQCQPLNQNFYEPNLSYNTNSSGFDQYQPPQYIVIHQPPQETSVEILQDKENLMKSIQTFLKKFNRISFREMPKVLLLAWEKFFELQHAFREKQHQPEDIQELLHKLLKDLQIISEELAEYINSSSWNCPAFYDDDDEYTIQYREYLENSSNAIAPVLPTEEPDNSLSMGDEHLSTVPETKLDKLIKSSVENLVPIPSESEDFSDNESECDVPVCDDFMTFSNPLFDYDDDFSSRDDESFSDEDVSKEIFKIYSNPLFDEENISSKIDPHHFNAESDLIESLLNRYISTVSYPKIDYLLEEFSGELTHINLIPPGINEADFDPEEEIRLIEELFDSLMEEIDIFLDPDDSIPPGIKSDDYDLEGDILFLKELLSNDSLSLPETESFHFDHYDVPSSLHIDTLLPFSFENEDRVFNPGILSSPLLFHRGKITSDFSESSMMIYGEDIPILDVLYHHFYPP